MYSFIVNPANKQIYDPKTIKALNILKNQFNQNGGKYISKGTYKCVHSPPISCSGKSKKYNSSDYISALTTNAEAVNAKKNEKIKKQIDPDDRFTVKLEKVCKIGKLDPITESTNEFKNCSNTITGNFLANYEYPFEYYDYDDEDSLRLIISKHGGLDLVQLTNHFNEMNLKKSLILIPKLFKSFKNVFYGLSRFKEEKFIHCDIKPNNILYNMKSDRFNIIDLGLMRNFSNALSDEYFIDYTINISQEAYYYRYWSVNSGVAALFLRREKDNMDINFSPPISQGPSAYNDVRNPNIIRKLYYDNITNTEDFIRVSKEKLDTYSLGITIKEFFYSPQLNSLVKKLSNKYPSNASIKKIIMIKHKLFNLVTKMIKIDPFQRISIHGALKEYSEIIKLL
tara:strand:+ start:2669 stop:3859 length:1191 start_codon:yes stop_codon:yes gene_type:complete